MQVDRYAAKGVYPPQTPRAAAPDSSTPRPAPPTLAESAEAFTATDDPVAKARLILQNPDFLEMALKQDPNATRELASLCDSLSQTLHMELDEKLQRPQSRMNSEGYGGDIPVGTTIVYPSQEQQTAPVTRLRM